MSPIPSYKRPPVVETVVGVEFQPLPGWGIQHFGLLWSHLRRHFPIIQVQPPLASQIEAFPHQPVNQQIELVQGVEARCWYVSGDDRNLVQVQRDRFLYNWRKGDSDVEYPRFEKSVRPQFEDNWSRFRDFLETEQLGAPVVVQCEVTYVNHIPRGEGWQSTGDWHRVFNALAPLRDMKFLPSPEAGRIAFNFLMPEQQGRLRVSINQAIRHTDGVDLIVLQLTARGRPKSSEAADIVNWLNLGREWVVRGFTDLTTQSMHKLWEREE